MNNSRCTNLRILGAVLVVAFLVATSGISVAQDVYKINYFANANTSGAPDATVRISNPGMNYANKYTCANIYVHTADQQMAECCSCANSHNNLATYSVNLDLTSNPLTPAAPITGVFKIISSEGPPAGTCDATSGYSTWQDLRAWATHSQNKTALGNVPWPITETEFSDVPLDAAELAAEQAQCLFIGVLGSGHGICNCPKNGGK